MGIPVHRLRKDVIIWLNAHKCEHGHTYLSHYACYLRDNPNMQRRGYLDIETSNLNADFGVILCYVLKEAGDAGRIYSKTITSREVLHATQPDVNVLKSLVSDLKNFDIVYTYFGCVTPEHHTLNDKLEWVYIGDLKEGDKIIGCNEERTEPHQGRKWEIATVEKAVPYKTKVVSVDFSNGDNILCTPDHPFLSGWPEQRWMKVDSMNKMTRGENSYTHVEQFMPMWRTDDSYDNGYMAGFADGEGSIRKTGHFEVILAQKRNDAFYYAMKVLKDYGYDVVDTTHDGDVAHIYIRGGVQEHLRFMGEFRPKRLLKDMDINVLNDVQMRRYKTSENNHVVNVEPFGERTVIGLQTSSKTYLVDGYMCHNTKFDLPYIRTRAVSMGIPFPLHGELKHKDIYYVIRNKFKLHRNRLEVACQELLHNTRKSHWDGNTWRRALQGDKQCLKYIQEHCVGDVLDLEDLTNKVIEFAFPVEKSI